MIKLTLTIEDLKDGRAQVDVNSKPIGKSTGIEAAHARTILLILESREYQELVRSSFIENGDVCQCKKCKAERKQSEVPIRLVH